MMPGKMIYYVIRNFLRYKSRSLLTIFGIAISMFLFCFIEGLQTGVKNATENEASANSLIVFQQSRFCPATSRLPERYSTMIEKIPGVSEVLPVMIYVNNCRASLDSVTFRGIPDDILESGKKSLNIIKGSLDNITKSPDAALVGQTLASRRNLDIGSRLKIGEIEIVVGGIYKSNVPGENNIAYAKLNYIQQTRGEDLIGRVTQFEVKINNPAAADTVIAEIDSLFRAEEIPTTTKTHKAFVATASGDIINTILFTRLLGFACVFVILGLTANTIYIMVQDRIKELAILQTLGFSGGFLFGMVILESFLLSLCGGIIGTAAAAMVLIFGNLGLGTEGVQIAFTLSPSVVINGLLVTVFTGLTAGLIPAIQSAIVPITDSLRRI